MPATAQSIHPSAENQITWNQADQIMRDVAGAKWDNAILNKANYSTRVTGADSEVTANNNTPWYRMIVEDGGKATFYVLTFGWSGGTMPTDQLAIVAAGTGSDVNAGGLKFDSTTLTASSYFHAVNGGSFEIGGTMNFSNAQTTDATRTTSVGVGSQFIVTGSTSYNDATLNKVFILAEIGAGTDIQMKGTVAADFPYYLMAAPDASGAYTPFANGTYAPSAPTTYGGAYAYNSGSQPASTFTPATMGTSGGATINLANGGRAALAGTAVINFAPDAGETGLAVTITSEETGPTVGAGEEVMGAYDFTAGSYVPADGAILAMYFDDLDSDYWNGDKIEVYRDTGTGWAQFTEANEAMISQGWMTFHDGAYQSGYDYAVVKTGELVLPPPPPPPAGTLVIIQ